MLANLTSGLDFQSKALMLRAERQRAIASNIANADTPGYVARDLDFKAAMMDATSSNQLSGHGARADFQQTSHSGHIPIPGNTSGSLGNKAALGYAVQTQPSMDGNSVDLDRERASFVDNAVRYEATLRFINGQSKTILSAIQGQ
jgi:flagellar basal-body rod protein FlgB